MSKFNIEYTDTFGGEPNYSWVRRETIIVKDAGFYANAASEQRMIMKAAKAALGLTGVKGRTDSRGDSYEFRPYGMCTVLFVTWNDLPDNDDSSDLDDEFMGSRD